MVEVPDELSPLRRCQSLYGPQLFKSFVHFRARPIEKLQDLAPLKECHTHQADGRFPDGCSARGQKPPGNRELER